MSVNLDASGIGQLVLKLGLASDAQVQDCLIELDDRKAPADAMVRRRREHQRRDREIVRLVRVRRAASPRREAWHRACTPRPSDAIALRLV